MDLRPLTVVASIATILVVAGLAATPSTARLTRDARLLETVIADVRRASRDHYRDTGRWAREDPRFDHDLARGLSVDGGVKGWAGPYLATPLRRDHNPFGGDVAVLCELDLALGGGFPTIDAGKFWVRLDGEGAFVRFTGVPESVARELDDLRDDSPARDWHRLGKVLWAGGVLDVLLGAP